MLYAFWYLTWSKHTCVTTKNASVHDSHGGRATVFAAQHFLLVLYMLVEEIHSQVVLRSFGACHRSVVKSSLILLPLLGSTCAVAILLVNYNTTVYSVVFTVLYSLQVKA